MGSHPRLPGPYTLRHFLRAEKRSPGGSVRLARVTWGVRPGSSGHQDGRFVEAKRTFFTKRVVQLTVWSSCPDDRTWPHDCAVRSTCGERGEGRKVRHCRTETLFLKPRTRDQSVRSTDRFVKISVSLRRNGQFAAESDPPGRFLNDPNEEIDPGGGLGVNWVLTAGYGSPHTPP